MSTKERPIIFSGEMVRAILDGRKTQTRRIIKSPAKNMQKSGQQVITRNPDNDPWYGDKVWSMRSNSGTWEDYTEEKFISLCPYGKPCDRLWVRETWSGTNSDEGPTISYKADHHRRHLICEPYFMGVDGSFDYEKTGNTNFDIWASDLESTDEGWMSSIHMPRWASRITLEIVDIRVERLQDISEEDAKREAVDGPESESAKSQGWYVRPRAAFRFLWQSIHGTESWNSNPWVWVIEFKWAA